MEFKKGFKRWAPSAALAATLLASTSAFAGNQTVDGVTFPVGFVPGGVGFVTQGPALTRHPSAELPEEKSRQEEAVSAGAER